MYINSLNRFLITLAISIYLSYGYAATADRDSDGDGISDVEEAKIYRTDSQLVDTDTDGLAAI